MKIFVTGGAGYVGSHCVRLLCDRGHEVVVFDNLSSGHTGAVDKRASLVVGDLSDRGQVEKAMRLASFDAVMHFAAYLDVGESVREPLSYYRNNVSNSVLLLEVMRDCGVRNMVFSSSCATYGDPPSVPISEDMPQAPINPYGRTKLAIEWAIGDCCRAWGLSATALRYFNAAGAAADGSIGEDHDPEIHLIPRALFAVTGRLSDFRINGDDYPTPDGTCIRDYVHVEDLASAHLAAVESQSEGVFRYLNLGTGVGTSVREIIDAVAQVTGKTPDATIGPRRAGDPAQLFANPSQAMAQLNWKAEYTDIRRIVETAWAWHRAHPSGFDE